jgi:hypothetical protein
MAGATGLDYAAALAWLRDVEGLAGDELRERMHLLRGCEHAVLEVYARRDDDQPMG